MADLHEVVFRWPYTDATTVILTGTFDQWSRSIPLTKVPTGFEGTVKIPYEDKVAYKFIVDGRWAIQDDQPTEADRVGNINNVYTAPRKPPFPAVLASEFGFTPTTAERVVDAPALPATGLTSAATPGEESQIERAHSSIVQPPEDTTNALSSPEGASTTTEHLANGVHVAYASESAAPKDRHIDETLGATFPQLVTDFADTIAARDGASTTLEYVASGLGAAIQSFVGVDPINPDKIEYKPPVPSAQFDEPGILTEEPQVPTEALLAKPEPLMLTSAENACGDVSTLTPAITSVIDDASALSVLSAPSEQTVVPELKMLPDAVKIAPFESQSPEPSATTPTTAASIKTLPEATVDTEIVHSTGTSAKVAELVLPEERSTHAISKTAPFEPQSAALAPAVFASKYSVSAPEPTASEPEFSAAVDREHTPEPVTPTPIINQPEHAALADNTVPENPVIGEAKAATAATQLESPSVSREQSNTIQSKPGQVTSTHTSQLSLCVTRTPATSETESPIAAKTEVVPDQAKNPSNLTEAASAEVVSPASVEPPVQAHLNITHPEESVTSALALPDSMAPTDGTTSVPSVPATEPDVSPAVPTASVLSGRPSTSVKGQAFPSSGSPGSTSSSPISSRVGTTSSRKKRKSIFGKLKDMFSKDEKGKS